MLNKKFGVLLITVLVMGTVLFGCEEDQSNTEGNPGNQGNPGNTEGNPGNQSNPGNTEGNPGNQSNPDNTVNNWLVKKTTSYRVTNGIAGAVSNETEYNWIRYVNDRNYECEVNSSVVYDTVQVTENASLIQTVTQTGFQNSSRRYNMNGNVMNYASNSISDITSKTENVYVSDLIPNSVTTDRIVQEMENNQTHYYDPASGLLSRRVVNSSTAIRQNDNPPTISTGSMEIFYAIDLIEDSGGVKTFRLDTSRYVANGTEIDVGLLGGGHTIYKIRNGITLEQISFNADGNITLRTVNSNISNGIALTSTTYSAAGSIIYVTERMFPSNNTIRSRLPSYTVSTTTDHINGSVATQTAEVLSESSTRFVIRERTFTNNVLTAQTDTEYERR